MKGSHGTLFDKDDTPRYVVAGSEPAREMIMLLFPAAITLFLFVLSFLGSLYVGNASGDRALRPPSVAGVNPFSSPPDWTGEVSGNGAPYPKPPGMEICQGQPQANFTTTACSCNLDRPVLQVRAGSLDRGVVGEG